MFAYFSLPDAHWLPTLIVGALAVAAGYHAVRFAGRTFHEHCDPAFVLSVLVTAVSAGGLSVTLLAPSPMPEPPRYKGTGDHTDTLRSVNYDKQLELWERTRSNPVAAPVTPLPYWTFGGFLVLTIAGGVTSSVQGIILFTRTLDKSP